MRKLARTQMRLFVRQQLSKQGGLCPLCHLPIDTNIPKEAVLDHDHKTGECRGVLHRSCNGALGKMDHAIGRWGCKSMDYDKIVAYLESVLVYYKQPGLGVMYPTHKTEDEKRLKRNLQAKQQRAAKKARATIRLKPGSSTDGP